MSRLEGLECIGEWLGLVFGAGGVLLEELVGVAEGVLRGLLLFEFLLLLGVVERAEGEAQMLAGLEGDGQTLFEVAGGVFGFLWAGGEGVR